jgi:hypothetical protein
MIASPRTRIAPGLEVSFSFDPKAPGLRAHWHPDMPRRLDGQAIRRYRAARDQFVQTVAARLGGPVVVVDKEGDHLAATVVRPPVGGRA